MQGFPLKTLLNYLVVACGVVLSFSALASGDNDKSFPQKPVEGHEIGLSDTSLFKATVAWLAANHAEADPFFPLRVDPHPLRTDTDKTDGILALDLRVEDFADVPEGETERRRAILEKLDVPSADALEALNCVGTGGYPPPPDPETGESRDRPIPEHCKFTTVVLSQPRVLGKDIRAIQLVELTPSSFVVYDLIIRCTSHGWKVTQMIRLNGIMS